MEALPCKSNSSCVNFRITQALDIGQAWIVMQIFGCRGRDDGQDLGLLWLPSLHGSHGSKAERVNRIQVLELLLVQPSLQGAPTRCVLLIPPSCTLVLKQLEPLETTRSLVSSILRASPALTTPGTSHSRRSTRRAFFLTASGCLGVTCGHSDTSYQAILGAFRPFCMPSVSCG
ncbi:hypothetical protein VNO77_33893 [Canavalia gladiata]|uniref:Uncharacterized protein n=1 Tax=Canavalia gladiata TaxID=3824 RepID=A0AAN9PY40_CANGL